MKISTKEQQRAEFLLQSQRIQLHQIEVSVSWNDTPGRRIRVSRQKKPNTAPEYSYST